MDRRGLLPVGNWVLVGEQLLLAGMGPAKYRMYAVLVLLSSDTAPMTTEHFLQHCPLHVGLRGDTWPENTLETEAVW